jgi:hypothetical protein
VLYLFSKGEGYLKYSRVCPCHLMSKVHTLPYLTLLTLSSYIHKMGADGGSIPDRSDMVKTKARSKVTDKDVLREIFFLCALSKVCPTREIRAMLTL